MNSQVEPHEPAPEFRAHLEWQIETALRRETRLAAPVSGRVHRLGLVLIVLAALATGGVAGMASGRVQDARQRDQLVEAARSDESLARVRLDLARTEYQEAQRRFETGTAGRESLLVAERQMRDMEASLARIRLDIEEIRATSAAPRNELQAPVVGQRDFVRERLRLELESSQHALVAAEQAVQQAQSRIEVGVVPLTALLQPESDLAQARARMQLASGLIDLRDRFVRGEIKAEALAVAARRMELTSQQQRAQRELELARRRVEELRSQFEIGRAGALDVKRSEVALLELQVELKRIQQELEALSAVKR
jgi:chromosome segregation ATPase